MADEAKMWKSVATILAVLIFLPTHGYFAAWAMKLLWQWYVVPVGLQPITLAQGFGLQLVWVFMAGKKYYGPDPATPEERTAKVFRQSGEAVLSDVTCFALGALVHWWTS